MTSHNTVSLFVHFFECSIKSSKLVILLWNTVAIESGDKVFTASAVTETSPCLYTMNAAVSHGLKSLCILNLGAVAHKAGKVLG